jgi:hypothetical protein
LGQDVPIFALTLALYNTRVIDYSTQSGIKLFNKSVEKLQETPIDIDADGLHSFLNAAQDRADSFGWENIIIVPKDIHSAMTNSPASPEILGNYPWNRSVITRYPKCTMNTVLHKIHMHYTCAS